MNEADLKVDDVKTKMRQAAIEAARLKGAKFIPPPSVWSNSNMTLGDLVRLERKMIPWDLRLWQAFTRVWHWYQRRRGFFVAMFGFSLIWTRKGRAEIRERNRICAGCERREGSYCKACDCPSWPLGRLGYKNLLAGHYCPLMRHPGNRYVSAVFVDGKQHPAMSEASSNQCGCKR